MLDTWRLNGRGVGGTFPSDTTIPCCRKLIRLDYIFMRDTGGRRILCKLVYVQDDGPSTHLASDHLPLCAVFVVGDQIYEKTKFSYCLILIVLSPKCCPSLSIQVIPWNHDERFPSIVLINLRKSSSDTSFFSSSKLDVVGKAGKLKLSHKLSSPSLS